MILQIVSVGPGDPSLLNQKTADAMKAADVLVLRTGRHPLSAWLEAQGIAFCTMDNLYETAGDFELLSESIARKLWKLASENGNTVYAVTDTMTDHTVDAVFADRPQNGQIVLIPGFSFADYYLPACREFFSTSHVQICPAASFPVSGYDPSYPLLITELNDEITAGEIKNRLAVFIRDEERILFLDKNAAVRPIPLFELDRQPHYDHLSAVAAGPYAYDNRNRKTLQDLMRIMDHLRSPEGCPWDRMQTHESLEPYVVEEAWEVVDAIRENRPEHLAEELGDLLFQIVFHTSIGNSFDEFSMDEVLDTICEKMIRRHPQVFSKIDYASNRSLPDSAVNAASWDRIKQQENGRESPVDTLSDVSAALPSLRYAEKILRRMEQFPGLALPSSEEALSSICRAANEIRNVSGQANAAKHLGSILLCCARLSGIFDTDCEVLLHQTIKTMIEKCQSPERRGKILTDTLKPLTFNDLGVY